MSEGNAGPKQYFVGQYVCPETDTLVPVYSALPLWETECPYTIETCPACGEKHTVACGDLLEADDAA